jgi:Ca-activated chloride channel family protein
VYRIGSTLALALASFAIFGAATSAERSAPAPLLLILDASGSMWGQIEGENKIVIARRVVGELVDGLDEASEVGVVAYGHRREGDCDDIETVAPIAALDKSALKETVNALNPKGKTPITRAVQEAFASLEGREGGAAVILVSDGLETCGGDPCAAVRAAKERGIDFVMHVVGFDLAGEDASTLECAAQAGEGFFSSAENAGELSEALEAALAMPAEVPAGRLSVKVIADGELQDAAIWVANAETGEEAGGGRTYSSGDTNPRVIPLADGRYEVKVGAVGIRGDVQRYFEIEIADGSLVEKELDYSAGEISVGVTRNGELSDAVYRVYARESGEEVAGGRTYTGANSNPARVRIVSGTYEVEVGSVEINGNPRRELGTITLEPGGSAKVSTDFASGVLKVGAMRDGELVDSTVNVVNLATGEPMAAGRTYTSESSNPNTYNLEPGDYKVTVQEIRGARRELTVTVVKGETVERIVDPAGSD